MRCLNTSPIRTKLRLSSHSNPTARIDLPKKQRGAGINAVPRCCRHSSSLRRDTWRTERRSKRAYGKPQVCNITGYFGIYFCTYVAVLPRWVRGASRNIRKTRDAICKVIPWRTEHAVQTCRNALWDPSSVKNKSHTTENTCQGVI